jgi:photosystem II stability/assembly factor-like uncharacterized protein
MFELHSIPRVSRHFAAVVGVVLLAGCIPQPIVPPQAAPSGIAVVANDASVALSWSASSGADGYSVQRAMNRGGPYAQLASTASTDYTDSAVVNNTTYYYVVSAYNKGGGTTNSLEVSATPAPPIPPPTAATPRPRLPNVQLPAGVVAPSSQWINATGNLANMPSECGNLQLLSADPYSTRVIAGVALRGLFAADNGGSTWTALGGGAGSAIIINRPTSIVYDPDDANTFWESGTYNGGGVYITNDRGTTFRQLGNVARNDLVSVDLHDPARQTLLAGGHEQSQTLYYSADGGGSWTNVGSHLPADSNFSSFPLVLDSANFLIGACGFGSGACGIWRSDDRGQTWKAATTTMSPTWPPLWHSTGAIYWSLSQNGSLGVSTDGGNTWVRVGAGVSSPIELPDGRILALGSDHVEVSPDGRSWTPIGQTLPFQASGLIYSAWTKTMYIWKSDCSGNVLPDAIASAGFDYQK